MSGPAAPRVAVIGLGAMGLPIARRLATGMDLTAFEVVPDRRDEAAAEGIAVASTPAAAAAGASIAVVAVRTLEQTESCLFGADGAADALEPGSVVVLTSTVGADGARSVAERLATRDVELLDAPVSGGPARAASGELLVLVGGSESAIARARPVLDLLAGKLAVIGPDPGDGQAMKSVNQLLCGIHIAAAAEALVLAHGLGLNPATALETLGAGAAASFMLGDRGPRVVEALQGDEPEVRSRLDIFVKDMQIVADAARTAGLELPLATASLELFQRGDAAGLGAHDDSTISLLLSKPLTAR